MNRLVGTALLGFFAFDAAAIEIADYDTHPDHIISVDEFKHFIRDYCSPPVSIFDKDRDGRLSRSEIQEIEKELASRNDCFASEFEGFRSSYPNGKPLADTARHYRTDDAKDYGLTKLLPRAKVLIRETYEQLSVDLKPIPVSKARGAHFAITGDRKSGNRTVKIKGSILRPIPIGNNRLLLPGVEFNRVTNKNEGTTDIDTLTLRTGLHFVNQAQTIYLRLNPLVSTSSDFDVDIRALELQVEPVINRIGLGASHQLGPIDYLGRLMLHGEYGRVFDNGQRSHLLLQESFTRLGPRLSLDLWPRAHDRLSMSLDFEYLRNLDARMRARRLFKATLSYDLDADGALTLETKYTSGDSSVALEDEETWTIGVAFKM